MFTSNHKPHLIIYVMTDFGIMSFNLVLFAIKTSSALFHLYEILSLVLKALKLKKEP